MESKQTFTIIPDERLERMERQIEHLTSMVANSQSKISDPDIMTLEDAADFLGISKYTLYGFTSRRLIDFHKRGRRIYFDRQALRRWITSEKKQPINQPQ